jgi:hypothetical protein
MPSEEKIKILAHQLILFLKTLSNELNFIKGTVSEFEIKLKIEINELNLLNTKNEISNSIRPENAKCFIATAAMGSYDHPVVIDLRNFRDNWLLKREWGIKFTKWYYIYGEKAAKVIEQSTVLKRISYYLIVKPLQILTKKLR